MLEDQHAFKILKCSKLLPRPVDIFSCEIPRRAILDLSTRWQNEPLSQHPSISVMQGSIQHTCMRLEHRIQTLQVTHTILERQLEDMHSKTELNMYLGS